MNQKKLKENEEKIKNLLNTIEDNIPYDYCKSEGTEDGLYHEWIDKDSWQYKALNYIKELQKENQQLKEQLKQRDEVIDEISQILNKHRFEVNDDYYDYSEQGICITGWDNDYDKLNDLLQKYKGDNK